MRDWLNCLLNWARQGNNFYWLAILYILSIATLLIILWLTGHIHQVNVVRWEVY